jgi:hypothetical protein
MKVLSSLFLSVLLWQFTLLAQGTNLGRHTIAEWHHLIDSTWGEGQSTAQKLQIFDNFWNAIDQRYAGFAGIEDNWQQMYNYHDTIALGVSRGRFSGILSHVVQSLHDGHVYLTDEILASTQLERDLPLIVPVAIEYPSFNWNVSDHFGAALTPLPDSTLLVYSAVNNHPLGLVPGDIILGYDGIPWNDLYKEILEVQFPMSHILVMTCSDRAAKHQWLGTAGMNWHLFDVIDIVKYSTGDTIHLPTTLLSDPMPGIHATEQLPINGVPFPDVQNGHRVSWGYIEGTNIGYIYVWGWNFLNSIDTDFLNAVNALMPDSSSDGIIIDLRINEGCDLTRWTSGFRRLFNQDIDVIRYLERANPTEHLTMQNSIQWNNWIRFSNPDQQLYDRPIAVLCGPWTSSGGDLSVQLLRQHPMVRTFGKPTQGAFGITMIDDIPGIPSDWTTGLTVAVAYTPPDWNNILNRVSIPVDEEVWLTPDGVANGEDDVVKSAIGWINNLVFPHNINTDKSYYLSLQDTVHLSTFIENPNSHQLSARTYFETVEGILIDSVDLVRQTLNPVGEQWIADLILPPTEEFYKISVTSFDQTTSVQFSIPNATRFTTAGPIVLDSIYFIKASTFYQVKPFVKNQSTNTTITNAFVSLKCDDPWVQSITPDVRYLPNIPPGGVVSNPAFFNVQQIDTLFPGYFNFKVEVMIDGWTYWEDSVQIIVGVEEDLIEIPREFLLSQNYPNPFNPNTKIKYSVPQISNVVITVFDVLGNEIETLVNEEKSAGNYSVEFNAANLPSGVYFYQLKAGEFISTKKMILLK